MHDAARSYILSQTVGKRFAKVVEVGGRNINGSLRDAINADEYISIDLKDGPDVDVVGDCRDWQPPWPASLVLCAEVLEHTDDPGGVVAACISYLRPGGRLILTCAGPGRPHSGVDGMELRPGEVYTDIQPDDLKGWLVDL